MNAIEVAAAFEVLLAQENASLRQGDFVGATALAPRKEELVAALNRLTLGDPSLMQDSAFAAVGVRLHALAIENRTLLEAAMQAQARMIRMIAGVPTSRSVIYRRDGGFRRPPLRRGVLLSEAAVR